jgi:hypothetical protein
MNINEVYKLIQFIVNKEQSGYVSPDEFNLIINQAQISYMDYFKYVNRGRKPKSKRVPIPALLEWIKYKKIKPRDKKGRFIKMKPMSLAFAIQTNIYKFGIRPANIFDKTYDDFEDVLINPPAEFRDEYEQLYQAIGEDVENFIINTINKELPSR